MSKVDEAGVSAQKGQDSEMKEVDRVIKESIEAIQKGHVESAL